MSSLAGEEESGSIDNQEYFLHNTIPFAINRSLAEAGLSQEGVPIMTRSSTQRFALLTVSLAMLLVTLALASASASASNFCGGAIVNSSQTCYGAARTFQVVQGSGESTGVCVGYNEIAYGACTSAANVIAQWNTGSYAFRVPRIIGWSPSNTVAHGDAY